MNALERVFQRARSEGRAALIGYLPAGFPTPDAARDLIAAMVSGGVDIVEVGLPYSDPLMDGPVIQQAVDQALRAGTTTDDVLETVAATARTGAATVVMSYWNPIERYGVERFADRLAEAGGCGVITPDLTPEEARPWVEASRAHGLDRIFLCAPSSRPERIAHIASVTSGFVYAASTMGVTGVRSGVSQAAPDLVERIRRETDLPIAVGLGVSTGKQAAEIAVYADGVIVGSAFVQAIVKSPEPEAAREAVVSLARELAAGVRRRTTGD